MPRHPKEAIHPLCETLEVEDHFFIACLEESVIEVDEIEGRLELTNGTALRLRRLQRICFTFNVEVPVAVLMMRGYGWSSD